MDSHAHALIGGFASGTAVLISFSELEAWLRVASLFIGIAIGLVSLFNMIRKPKK